MVRGVNERAQGQAGRKDLTDSLLDVRVNGSGSLR